MFTPNIHSSPLLQADLAQNHSTENTESNPDLELNSVPLELENLNLADRFASSPQPQMHHISPASQPLFSATVKEIFDRLATMKEQFLILHREMKPTVAAFREEREGSFKPYFKPYIELIPPVVKMAQQIEKIASQSLTTKEKEQVELAQLKLYQFQGHVDMLGLCPIGFFDPDIFQEKGIQSLPLMQIAHLSNLLLVVIKDIKNETAPRKSENFLISNVGEYEKKYNGAKEAWAEIKPKLKWQTHLFTLLLQQETAGRRALQMSISEYRAGIKKFIGILEGQLKEVGDKLEEIGKFPP